MGIGMELAAGIEKEKGFRVLLEAIVNCFPGAAGADYSEITLFDENAKAFTCAAATGKDRDAAFSGQRFGHTRDESKKILTQKVMESGNPLIIHDVGDQDLSGPDRDMAGRLGIKSIAVFPLFDGKKFLGSISFDHGEHTHKFTPQDINAMHLLADLAARMVGYAERLTGR